MEKFNFPKFVKIAVVRFIEESPYALSIDRNKTIFTEDARLISFLSETIGFKYEIVMPEDGKYGQLLPNGTWNGLIGLLQRREADLAFSRLTISYERFKAFRFSYPYLLAPQTFMSDALEYLPNSYRIMQSFSISVWVSVVISLFVMLVILPPFKTKKNEKQSMLLIIYQALLSYPTRLKSRKLSTKLFMISWIIGGIFLTQAYKAVLLSFLTLPMLSGIRNSIELAEATDDNTFKCSTYEGSYIIDIFLNSEEEKWRKIGECLKRSNMLTSDAERFLLPRTYKKAFIGQAVHLKSYENDYFLWSDSFMFDPCGIGMRNAFCCKDVLDNTIHRMMAGGLLQKLEADELFMRAKGKRKNKNPKDERKIKALQLEDLSAAFVLLFIGYTSAFVVLVAENLMCSILWRNRHRVRKLKQKKNIPET